VIILIAASGHKPEDAEAFAERFTRKRFEVVVLCDFPAKNAPS
jgi:hypothetical protein